VILHHHQKAKHFSCPKCPKKFSSIDSMSQHCRNQHTLTIEKVPNAMAGRDNPMLKIFGMQGVPRIEIESWMSKQVNKYWGRRMDRKLAEKRLEQEKKGRAEKEKVEKGKEMEEEEQKVEEEGELNMDMPLKLSFE
jgi:hypothetical protein